MGRLESSIVTQSQHVFEKELYKGEIEKADALIRVVIDDHPFADGNKRKAMLAGITFLKINNNSLMIKEAEIENFAVKIAVENLDVSYIAVWLDSRAN